MPGRLHSYRKNTAPRPDSPRGPAVVAKLLFVQLKHFTPTLQKLYQRQLLFAGEGASACTWGLERLRWGFTSTFSLGMLAELSV